MTFRAVASRYLVVPLAALVLSRSAACGRHARERHSARLSDDHGCLARDAGDRLRRPVRPRGRR